jgi:CubicO group peptidase (beta-lactamase class C family)
VLEATDDAILAARLDGLFSGLMATHRIPGAVFVLVRDGRVAIARGYGVADLETGRPVDPERTGFRVASISKLFTATAALQQVERSRLSLDQDVNASLDGVTLEDAYGAPVTLRHLLTHTGGFDDRHLGTAQLLDSIPVSLRDYLAARMPPRVMPPGPIISYSNHGFALAGLLVEQATGVPFAEYVRREILEPLGMTHSGFGVPTPVPETLARPYAWAGTRHRDLGFDRLLHGPAGDLVTTGTDLARFMLAQLADGSLDGARILGPETLREMHREQVTLAPGLPGWALGFAVDEHHGVRALAHGGSWRGFASNLTLVPEAGVGWFVSTNHDFHPEFMRALREGLWETLVPNPAPALPPAQAVAGDEDYLGSYVPNRRARGSFMKLVMLLQEVRVVREADGALALHSAAPFLDGLRLHPLETGRFASTRGEAVFARDASGRVKHLFVDNTALDRVSWSPRSQALLAGGCAALFLGTLAGFLLGGLARLVGGAGPSPIALHARLLASGVSALFVVWLLGLGMQLANPDVWQLTVAVPPRLEVLSWAPVAALPLVAWLAVESVRGGSVTRRSPLARLLLWLLVAAAILMLAGAIYWHLLAWML